MLAAVLNVELFFFFQSAAIKKMMMLLLRYCRRIHFVLSRTIVTASSSQRIFGIQMFSFMFQIH